MTALRDAALNSRAWPVEEARKILKRIGDGLPGKGYVLFQTGYGPSGLPHIGTFGEVARTSMVRFAFEQLSGLPTRLFAFSDDMDGMRKVPDNVPNREMLERHLKKPLTSVPDPFGTHESFGHHNNARLRQFLDRMGFGYEFKSATDAYKSGAFDDVLLRALDAYDEIMAIVLPELGAERRRTYSPFLPICPRTGRVLEVPVIERHPERGSIVYEDEDSGEKVEVQVTGGRCKLQWRPDWAMRWAALDVDYEMSGKDLISSFRLSSRICKVLGGTGPEGFHYELDLDENGEKISKTKGNGLAVEEWLRYASEESLMVRMFQNPRRAKRLYFDVIPRAVDDYLGLLESYPAQPLEERLGNPVWYIHKGNPPEEDVPVSFSTLLNLVSASNAHDRNVLWGFISRYAPHADAKTHPVLDRLVGHAVAYYEDFVKPTKSYRAPSEKERAALEDLVARLSELSGAPDAEALQNAVYAVGKAHDFENLRDWFKALYEILFGQSQGPRMGSFVALYGVDESIALIKRALAGEDLAATD